MVMPKPTANSEQVLEVLLDVVREHMSGRELGASYRVRSAVRIGSSGNVLSGEEIITGRDVPVGLLLTMADGNEYKLTLVKG